MNLTRISAAVSLIAAPLVGHVAPVAAHTAPAAAHDVVVAAQTVIKHSASDIGHGVSAPSGDVVAWCANNSLYPTSPITSWDVAQASKHARARISLGDRLSALETDIQNACIAKTDGFRKTIATATLNDKIGTAENFVEWSGRSAVIETDKGLMLLDSDFAPDFWSKMWGGGKPVVQVSSTNAQSAELVKVIPTYRQWIPFKATSETHKFCQDGDRVLIQSRGTIHNAKPGKDGRLAFDMKVADGVNMSANTIIEKDGRVVGWQKADATMDGLWKKCEAKASKNPFEKRPESLPPEAPRNGFPDNNAKPGRPGPEVQKPNPGRGREPHGSEMGNPDYRWPGNDGPDIPGGPERLPGNRGTDPFGGERGNPPRNPESREGGPGSGWPKGDEGKGPKIRELPRDNGQGVGSANNLPDEGAFKRQQ